MTVQGPYHFANLRGGDLIARDRHIRGHLNHAARAATGIFIAFNIAIIGIQEPEGGAGTEPVAALNGPNHEICASRRVIDGEGRAIESVRCSGFDRLQKRRHTAGIRESVLRLSARSGRLAFHHEAV